MLMYLSFSQLCHILTSKVGKNSRAPLVSWEGYRMSCAGSSRAFTSDEKTTHSGLWPQVVRNTPSFFKILRNIWFQCVCVRTERKEAALSMWKPWKDFYCAPFVHAHICLHLWNACVLLWQRSRSLVLFFVRAPAFNRSGLCHINTARREDLLWAAALHFIHRAGPSVSQGRRRKKGKWVR